MFCTKCGVQNDDSLNFCCNCGAPLEAAPQQQAAPQQPVYQQPPVAPQQPVYQQPPVAPQQPVYQQPYAPTPAVPGKGLGISGMVLGIFGLALICLGWVSIISSIIGIILSAVGLAKAKKVGLTNGMATAGIVCSSIALGLYLVLFIIGIVAGVSLAGATGTLYY